MEENTYQEPNTGEEDGIIEQIMHKVQHYVQIYVDRYAIYPKTRWLFAGVVFGFYVYRAYVNNGTAFSICRTACDNILLGTLHVGQIHWIHLPKKRRRCNVTRKTK